MRLELTKAQVRHLEAARAKLDPEKVKSPPRQSDYLEDVPFLLALVERAYRRPSR